MAFSVSGYISQSFVDVLQSLSEAHKSHHVSNSAAVRKPRGSRRRSSAHLTPSSHTTISFPYLSRLRLWYSLRALCVRVEPRGAAGERQLGQRMRVMMGGGRGNTGQLRLGSARLLLLLLLLLCALCMVSISCRRLRFWRVRRRCALLPGLLHHPHRELARPPSLCENGDPADSLADIAYSAGSPHRHTPDAVMADGTAIGALRH